MTCKCVKCGDKFTPAKEEIQDYEDGAIDLPTICDECWNDSQNTEREDNLYFDPEIGGL